MSDDELLKPDEWSRRKGIFVADPDGWRAKVFRFPRGEILYGPKSLDEPITEAEFDKRASVSSCISRRDDGSLNYTGKASAPALLSAGPETLRFNKDPKFGEPLIDPHQPGAVMKWADAAMYRSEPAPAENRAEGGGTRPTVRLLNATPDPLGSLAALCGIYKGKVFRSLSQVDDDERRQALADMTSTVLNGPLEAITFHFLVEGVTRSFTHQAVRNRFSFFAQESMRFAVVDGEKWTDRCAYPPSLAAQPERPDTHEVFSGYSDQPINRYFDYSSPEARDYALQRDSWDWAVITAQQSYQRLIDAGVPAEDARGLMPHAMTTRYHWVVSLRTLLGEAGKRLCTQAQFEWRTVMAEVAKAIRGFATPHPEGGPEFDAWQFEAMADLLKPVCYAEGKCGFMAKFDRGCKIRDRVNANAAVGRPSSEWGKDYTGHEHGDAIAGIDCAPEDVPVHIKAIQPSEWLADPGAAR